MVKKLSLGGGSASTASRVSRGAKVVESDEVLELFFDVGIVFHDVSVVIPDAMVGFVPLDRSVPAEKSAVRRAEPGEDADIEIPLADALTDLAGRWIPIPYPLSNPLAAQLWIDPLSEDGSLRAVLAVDTTSATGGVAENGAALPSGKLLDPVIDAGRPYRALGKGEIGPFLDIAAVRTLTERLERQGIAKPLFKLAALAETIAPQLPRLLLARVDDRPAIGVTLVLDFGNSRTTALLVEGAGQDDVLAIPLQLRNFANPTEFEDGPFDSRVTFLPSPFEGALATGDGFVWPSVARLGREAQDRALETPHRYPVTLSGPKRYLWDARSTDERWHVARAVHGDFPTVSGRLLKYVDEAGGGLILRADGPSAPADPRYAPRAMMLFALAEILSQANAQVNGKAYRKFQGKEQNARFLEHVVLTFPSAMSAEERAVYDALVRNAVHLVTSLFHLPDARKPNFSVADKGYYPFLFADEALAAQMVYVYEEVRNTFSGSFEDFAGVYGKDGKVRIASVDIGGGTTDVLVADYEDRLPGVGTALSISKVFQDGADVAGDEVCRALLEGVILPQILEQIPSPAARRAFAQLFDRGDAGRGSSWRTLRARLVPHFWLPLARLFWGFAEGKTPENYSAEKLYLTGDAFQAFGVEAPTGTLLDEGDRIILETVKDFPGLRNLFFRFDLRAVEEAILRVLREPLRRFGDLLAQLDVDVLVLAGRTAKLPVVTRLFSEELCVSPPRIKSMADFAVGEWYPSSFRRDGKIDDPKSTVVAGCAILHLASRNRIPGFLLDRIIEAPATPIYGLWQEGEPHLPAANELFAGEEKDSPPFVFTNRMLLGVRRVASEEMDASPLFEVVPATTDVAQALLDDRVELRFRRDTDGRPVVASVKSQRKLYDFSPADFRLVLRTAAQDRYWLDTGVLRTEGALLARDGGTVGARRD